MTAATETATGVLPGWVGVFHKGPGHPRLFVWGEVVEQHGTTWLQMRSEPDGRILNLLAMRVVDAIVPVSEGTVREAVLRQWGRP